MWILEHKGERVTITDEKLVPHVRNLYPDGKLYNDEDSNRDVRPADEADRPEDESSENDVAEDAGTVGQEIKVDGMSKADLVRVGIERGYGKTQLNRMKKDELINLIKSGR